MSIELVVDDNSSIGINLEKEWNEIERSIPYVDMVESLNVGVEDVIYSAYNRATHIKFTNESYKDWFVLRWS